MPELFLDHSSYSLARIRRPMVPWCKLGNRLSTIFMCGTDESDRTDETDKNNVAAEKFGLTITFSHAKDGHWIIFHYLWLICRKMFSRYILYPTLHKQISTPISALSTTEKMATMSKNVFSRHLLYVWNKNIFSAQNIFPNFRNKNKNVNCSPIRV